jgi:uncharacterized protein (DUF885 family)
MLRPTLLCATVLPFVSVLAGSFAAAPTPSPSAEVATLLDELSTTVLRNSPEFATSLAVSEERAGGPYAARLSDGSPAAQAAQVVQLKGFQARLDALGRAALAPDDAISIEVASALVEYGLAGSRFAYGDYGFGGFSPYGVTQLSGSYLDLPDFLDSQHAIKTTADAEAYLLRLAAFTQVLDDETASIRDDAAKGVVPPDFAIKGAIRQLDEFASTAPGETVLVASIRLRAATIPNLAPEAAADFAVRALALVRDQVLPAYRRQAAALQALLPKSSPEPGVWRLPQGDAYYAAALKAQSSTDSSPDEIHDLGLNLVASLRREIDRDLDAQKIPPGPLDERLRSVAKLDGQIYPDSDEGRATLLADLNRHVALVQARLPDYFGRLPKAAVEIKRIPVYSQAGAPGGYYQPAALDGSRPGAYYINLRDTAELPRFSLPTLNNHEAVPGHHLQISIQQELTGLPFFRTALAGFNAFDEGWALYAEQLADEMGLYADDPLGRIGYLQASLFRAARLVVDTGIHHKRWSREQAVVYMIENTGDQRSSIETEIERYAVWPGQATGYMVGRELINRLRARARAELGAAFDLKAFHDVVLSQGSIPLTTLEREITAWIAARKAATPGPDSHHGKR